MAVHCSERRSNYRELKDIVSCGLLEVETLSDNDKHAPAEENNKTANAPNGLSSKTSRVHPSETTVTADRPKFHEAGNFFRLIVLFIIRFGVMLYINTSRPLWFSRLRRDDPVP